MTSGQSRVLFINAIKALPDDWVDIAIEWARLPNGHVVIAHPDKAPMIFKGERWEQLAFPNPPA